MIEEGLWGRNSLLHYLIRLGVWLPGQDLSGRPNDSEGASHAAHSLVRQQEGQHAQTGDPAGNAGKIEGEAGSAECDRQCQQAGREQADRGT